ncbi:MAG: DUF3574 domain-containing protein [Geminicoccaceae bacterium]
MTRLLLATASSALALALMATPAAATGGPFLVAPSLEAWTEIDLYLGRNIGTTGEVTEAQFRTFLREIVTPRFPDGLTINDALGQFHDGKRIIRGKTKLLVLLVPDSSQVKKKVRAIVEEYKKRFRQQNVLRTETSLCLLFD